MYRSILKALALVVTSSAMLTACGGGGSSTGTSSAGNTNVNPGGSTPTTPPVALPTTVISSVFDGKNDANQPLTMLLQNDGSYFLVYSDATAPANALGVMLGAGKLVNGSFSSSDSLNLSLVGTGAQSPNAITLSASYVQKQTVNGSYTAGTQTTSFITSYNNSYETLPGLTALAGVYTGSIATKDVREDNIVLTISADGTVTGQLTCGCSVGAKLVARSDGIAYDATLAFTEGTHPLTGKSFAGNVYLDAKTNRLFIVGKLSNSTDLAIFVGKKS